nr:YqaA family protein [Shimwellia pseudoproteus]
MLSLLSSSFLSATLLPGSSEAVLIALLIAGKSSFWPLVIVATAGNTLGGLTNVILGRFFPVRATSRWRGKATRLLERFGPVTLLLSWLPVMGDLLCLLAGWLRLRWGPVIVFIGIGKLLRYLIVGLAAVQGMAWWQ